MERHSDDSRGVINDCNIFIIQATGLTFESGESVSHHTLRLACFWPTKNRLDLNCLPVTNIPAYFVADSVAKKRKVYILDCRLIMGVT